MGCERACSSGVALRMLSLAVDRVDKAGRLPGAVVPNVWSGRVRLWRQWPL